MYKKTKYLFSLSFLFMCLIAHSNDRSNLNKTIEKYSELSGSFEAKGISTQALLKAIKNEDIILIDIREKEEQAVSILPNSITQEKFLSNPEKYSRKKLVAYCTIGYRSGKFCEKFKKWNILNLEGGVLAWSHFKGSFFKNGKQTNKVHVYSKEWNFLHSSYKAIFK